MLKLPSLLFLATLLLFLPTLSNDFVYDDYYTVESNTYIRDFSNIPAVFTNPSLWGQNPSGAYRPVFTLYLTLLYYLFKLKPLGYHLFNILLHAAKDPNAAAVDLAELIKINYNAEESSYYPAHASILMGDINNAVYLK